jgi:membrane-associated protein
VFAQNLLEKHSSLAIFLAPFLLLVRPLVPFLAGAAGMAWPKFFWPNVFGCLVWSVGLMLLGYVLGQTFDTRFLFLGMMIVLASTVTVSVFQFLKTRALKRNAVLSLISDVTSWKREQT